MAGLRDEVDLDVASALAQIDRLGASLTQVTQKFTADLAASVATVNSGTAKTATSGAKAANEQADAIKRVKHETEGATAATGKYGTTLKAVAQIRVVQGLIAFFGGRALVRQINDTVSAASDLNEQIDQSRAVFGKSSRTITGWAENAETQLALTRGAAIKFANDFGNIFTSQGFGDDQAALMSKRLVQLGSDIASFKDIPIEDALVKLRAGLVGEVEPLRTLGATFTENEVKARAMALGLGANKDQLTESAKIAARYTLILERTKNAHGDLARTSGSLANQQRFLRAEVGRVREEVGARLLPIFLDLTHTLRENLPEIQEIAENAAPALGAAFHALVPAGLAFANILVAVSTVLGPISTIINALPAPVLQLATAFVLLGSGIGPLPNIFRAFIGTANEATGAASGFLGEFKTGGGIGAALGAGFAAVNPYVIAAGVAITGLSVILSRHRKEQAENRRAIQATTDAFLDQSDAVDKDARSLAENRLRAHNQIDDIGRLGLTIKQFTALTAQGEDGFRKFIETGLKTGEFKLPFSDIQSLDKAVERFGSVYNAVIGGAVQVNSGLVESFRDVQKQIQEASHNALDLAVARGQLSNKDVRSAERDPANRLADGTINYFNALSKLSPALAAAVAGEEALAVGGDQVTSSMQAVDDALKAVKDNLDETFDRYLNAAEAEQQLSDAVFNLGKAIGEGRNKGETLIEFQDRLASSTTDVVKQVEDWALAQARAGKIGTDTASIQAAMRRQLILLEGTFPGLRNQLEQYVKLLGPDVLPRDIETKVLLDTSGAVDSALGLLDFLRKIAPQWADAVGAAFAFGPAGGPADALIGSIKSSVPGAGEAGKQAGAAAADGATSALLSARDGLDIGGFIIKGLDLGAREAQIRLKNFLAGQVMGMAGIVAEASKIDPEEQTKLLNAVQREAEAERNLAKVRDELGPNSIEAAVASHELRDAQEEVNKTYLDAIDATSAYEDQLKRVADAIDTVTGSLHALQALREARKAVDEAQTAAEKETENLTRFDARIGDIRNQLASALAAGDATSARRLQATLDDLIRRRGTQASKTADAQDALIDKQLDLVSSEQRLIDIGAQVGGVQGLWEGMFRSLATQAGLSKQAIDDLVGSLNNALAFAGDSRLAVLTGSAQQVNLPTAGTGALTLASTTSVAGDQVAVKIDGDFVVQGTGDALATASLTFDKMQQLALQG